MLASRARMRLTLIPLPGIAHIEPGDDLVAQIHAAALRAEEPFKDGDVVVVAQKIVSKAEGRYVDLRTIEPSPRARELAAEVDKDPRLVQVILSESTEVVRKKPGVLVVAHRLGLVLANAGIDLSNVEQVDNSERVLLLPTDPDASAARLRRGIAIRSGASVGVIITDSLGRAWRKGTVGFAIGTSGVASMVDLRGSPDLFGRALQHTEVGRADELAAAASVLMGQAAEGIPVVLVKGYQCTAPANAASALVRPRSEDLFR
jgi:coenzyme F420-0:L-glutamate ligase/coenzyme F420-1:gamma-L-glutamate ligase